MEALWLSAQPLCRVHRDGADGPVVGSYRSFLGTWMSRTIAGLEVGGGTGTLKRMSTLAELSPGMVLVAGFGFGFSGL